MRRQSLWLVAVALVAACDDDHETADGGGVDATALDAGTRADAETRDGGPRDSAAAPDAGRDARPADDDAGPAMDAASNDAGAVPDATAGDGGDEADAGDPTLDSGTPEERGAVLYAAYCALCHGARGEGYAADHAPAVANVDFLEVASDEFLRAAIVDGRPGTAMSAWGMEHGGPLVPDDAAAIVAFLRSFAAGPVLDLSGVTVSGDAARGAAIYATDCAVCHGARGEGASALSLDHPSFQATASDGFLRYTVEHGRRDTPMVGFGSALSATELDDVVAHLRTLRRPDTPPEWPIEPVPSLDSLVLNPTGEPPAFELREGRYVPAIVVKAAMDAGRRLIILDARATSDWVAGHIPGSAPFPFYDVDALAGSLPTDGTWIIAYCACPHAASGHVVDLLRARGFANTAVLDEGIFFWRDHGYPMARGEP